MKPSRPGFLLIEYSTGEVDYVETWQAPKEKDVSKGSPILYGDSEYECPYCENGLMEFYSYEFFCRIVNGKVYSYDTSEFKERIESRACPNCGITIFEWEIAEPFLEYEYITGSHEISHTVRMEPVACVPGVCPGKKKIAVGNYQFLTRCSEYPKCIRTKKCKEDWQVIVGDDKISIAALDLPRSLKRLLSLEYNV